MTRTKSSILNLTVAFGGQFIGLLISFAARIFFIRTLGEDYLGINGLFTNILTMLSLVELGVGPAMVFSLYQPLAQHNQEMLKSLMRLYRRTYIIIGCTIGLVGVLLSPYLECLIKEVPNIPHIQLIFILFVLNSSISYFYSYKRSFIIADQHRYIATIYRYIFYFVVNLLQIIFLLLTHSYIIFLMLQIAGTLLENFFISYKADQMYPFLKEKAVAPLGQITLANIKKNVFSMVFHKIGGIVVTATDNLLISRLIGIVTVGVYSNYQLVINALNTMIGQVGNAIVASVGNLGAAKDNDHLLTVFHRIIFFYFWIFGFSSVCLFCLFQPFVALSFGKELLLPFSAVAVLVLNFYLNGMRRATLVFRDALGLYWHDRYKPLCEALINLIFSITLGRVWGVTGIFLGTSISTLTTCFWVEPLVLYRYGLFAPLRDYFKRYGLYTLVTLVAMVITWLLCGFLAQTGILAFLGKIIICVTVPNLIYLATFSKTEEFRYFVTLARGLLRR